MTYHVHIPNDVKRQLRKIAARYRDQSGSTAVAEKWHDGFVHVLDSLEENPQRYGFAHESDLFPFEIREVLYGSGRKRTHRALFRISGNRVEVLVIRHVSQRDVEPEDLPE